MVFCYNNMRILFINIGVHHKNLNFILKCKNINFFIITNINDYYNLDLETFDAVMSPGVPIDVSKFPNTKFIFGPHFSVFPNDSLEIIKSHKTVYTQLSEWNVNCWKSFPICNNLNLVPLPFGVETEKFIPTKSINDRNKVLVYFKNRDPHAINIVKNFLKNKSCDFCIFSYGEYNENDYLNYLQQSKFGIWVGRHESQGFALQEALSCDVPLLVWNVKSMNQEYGHDYEDIPATTVSYWDNKCGEVFYTEEELEKMYNNFIERLPNYKPREFILDNLSIEACENKLVNLVNSM